MKQNIIILTITAVLFFITTANAQNKLEGSLTLEKAIELSLNNQPLIQQAESEINVIDAKIKEQESYDYPGVDAKLTYSRIGPVPKIVFGNQAFKLFPANNYDAHLSARYNVYDFGKKDAFLELTKSYKLSAKEKVELIKNDLSYKTAKLFYSILYLEKSLAVKDEQIKTLESHLELTKKKVENNSATDFDVLTTKVKVANAKDQRIDIENEITKEKTALRNLLGLAGKTELNLKGDFNFIEKKIDADSLLSVAYNQREELKLSADAVNSTKLKKEAASLSNDPSINLMAQYGIKNGFEPNLDALRGNWMVGVSANVPIFDGFRTEAKIEEAEAELDAQNSKIKSIKRKIKTEVEQSISELQTSKSKISTTALLVKQAEEALKRAKLSYQNGVITNLDLLDSETSLTEAKFAELRVIFQNVINSYSLKESIGDVIH